MLFPPLLGKVEILKREKETCKDKEGKPLCYTGRVHFQVPTEEFERIRHVIPTSLPMVKQGTKYCVFVNFEGSLQKCHKCNEAGHNEKNCPQLKMKQGAGGNDSVLVSGAGLPLSRLQSTPLKSPKKRKLTVSETEEKRGETLLKAIEEQTEENMELGKSLQLSKKDEKENEFEEEEESEDDEEQDSDKDKHICDVLDRSGKELRDTLADMIFDKSFGKGFTNFDRTPTKSRIEEAQKFYVPSNMKLKMKIPKFIYANDDRDDNNEEEADIGVVLACADRIQEHKEAVWEVGPPEV